MQYDMQDFTRDVLQRSHTTPVLVDFWAEWCAPCRMLSPILDRLAQQAKGAWVLVKVNTEEHPELAAQYEIQGIPAVKLFVDGEVAGEFVGALPEEMILQWLGKALPSPHRVQINQARTLLAEQQDRKAQKILHAVVKAEPENQQARILLAQAYVYDDVQKAVEWVREIGEGSEYADMAEAIRTFGALFDLRAHSQSLPDRPVKTTYLEAITVLRDRRFETALQEFIQVIRRDRAYDDDGARKACIAIFKFLGENHPLSQTYRRELSSALYV